jgi:carboxypeptidase family protein
MHTFQKYEQSDTNTQRRLAPRSYILLMAIAGTLLATPGVMLGQTEQVTVLHEAIIAGTVTDVNHDTVPDATVVLEGPTTTDRQTGLSNENGYFQFHGLKPGIPYQVNISAAGFADWHSPAMVLEPNQFTLLSDIELRIEAERTTINVTYDPEQAAPQQIKVEEQQRIFGFIPNYYVVYDPHPEPLSTKLKFQLAFKVVINPVTVAGIALQSAAQQAGDTLLTAKVQADLESALERMPPTVSRTLCWGPPFCHLCFTRIRVTSTRALVQLAPEFVTLSSIPSSARVIAERGSPTTPQSGAI